MLLKIYTMFKLLRVKGSTEKVNSSGEVLVCVRKNKAM